VQRIIVREQRKKEHKQLYRFLPQSGSSPVSLVLPRRVPLKCNVGLQVAQSHKKETYQCSRITPRDFYAQSHKKETYQCSRATPRDFYAQSHKKETYMLKDNSKRLLCSITQERDFYAQGQLQETSFAQSQLKETSLNNYK